MFVVSFYLREQNIILDMVDNTDDLNSPLYNAERSVRLLYSQLTKMNLTLPILSDMGWREVKKNLTALLNNS